MNRSLFAAALPLLALACSSAGSSEPHAERTTSSRLDTASTSWTYAYASNGLPYYALMPAGYTGSEPPGTYPVLLFLHQWGGETGGDVGYPANSQADDYFNSPSFQASYPAIVIAPQCEGSGPSRNWGGWDNAASADQSCGDEAVDLATTIASTTPGADASRILLTGYSMGGMGTWNLALQHPGTFARALSAAGSIGCSTVSLANYPDTGCDWATSAFTPQSAADILNAQSTPLMAAHGDQDQTVVPLWDTTMVGLLRSDLYTYVPIPGEGHGIGYDVYTSPQFLDWLFAR